jgi:lambda family phage tail tape measure protein
MAGKKVEVDLSLRDKGNSIKARTKEAKALNKELEKSQKLASGTKTGAQAAAMTDRSYGQARGAMGATGASGRDFANQAQGLGGLVRLYATYAANVFAVGAAFRALREAAAVDNMIRGMDQLGASSGLALGTMAKGLMDATGGAISLQEAIRATTKATSAGLNAQQFEQLGIVARKASLALGVNMEDAISRLSRGITKLEPELLDELGIFTKIGPATEKYANSIGKSVSQLTDFERRQAFANAVLEEGNQKFGDIEGMVNPYDKLSASLQNLAQEGLSLVNKVLVPIVDMLSQSPTALTGGLALIGTTIVKQALPALGQYRQELQEASKVSAEMAKQKAMEAEGARAAMGKQALQQLEGVAEAKIEAVDAAIDKVAKLEQKVGKNTQTHKILQKAIQDITAEDLKHLSVIERKLRAERNYAAADRYKETIVAINSSIQAEQNYLAKEQQINAELGKRLSLYDRIFTAQGRTIAAAERAQNIAARKELVSNAANDTQVGGMAFAFQNLKTGIANKGLTGFSATLARLSGIATIATTALNGLMSGISTVAMVVGIAVGAFTLLDKWLSTNSEQMDTYNKALDSTEQYTKALTATNNKYKDSLPAESLQARATAFNNMAGSINEAVISLEAAMAAASGWDRLMDTVMGWFGASAIDKMAENMTYSLTQAIGAVKDPEAKKAFEKEVRAITGGSHIGSQEHLSRYINNTLKAAGSDAERMAILKRLNAVLQNNNRLVNNAAEQQRRLNEEKKQSSKIDAKILANAAMGRLTRQDKIAKAREEQVPYTDQGYLLGSAADRLRISQRVRSDQDARAQAIEQRRLLSQQDVAKATMNELLASGAGMTKDSPKIREQQAIIDQLELEKAASRKIFEIKQKTYEIMGKQAVAATEISSSEEKAKLVLQDQQLNQKIISDATDRRLDYEKKVLQYQIDSGMLTADQAQTAQAILDKKVLAQQLAVNLAAEEAKHNAKILELSTKIALAISKQASPETIAALSEQARQENLRHESRVQSLNSEVQLGNRVIDMNNEMSASQKAFRDRFVQGFEEMGDAIVDFVMTGKASFGDLVKSMIADMIKLQMRQQMSQVGNFAMNALMTAFGGSPESRALMDGTMPLAKGGAFDAGVKAFAKGGMFTNSIVNQPTMFKFAQGVGLMGEAGPEAIMPLKRDSSGNLGVRSNGNSTQVTIINNTGQQVQQQETQDSKGNRKLEIVVGETAAGQVKTNGSQMQNSMRSTYGLQPALIRR